MSESQEAAEAVEEQEAAESEAEAPEAEAPAEEPEPSAEAPEPEPEAEAPQDVAPEPAEQGDGEEEVDPAVLAAEEELAEEAIPTPVGPASGRQARVFLCDRGHRTVAVWSSPSSCHARPTRSGGECGRQLYPIGELPEQVQKALNPLKASKKGGKA